MSNSCTKCLYKDSCVCDGSCGFYYPADDYLEDEVLLDSESYAEYVEAWAEYIADFQ